MYSNSNWFCNFVSGKKVRAIHASAAAGAPAM